MVIMIIMIIMIIPAPTPTAVGRAASLGPAARRSECLPVMRSGPLGQTARPKRLARPRAPSLRAGHAAL